MDCKLCNCPLDDGDTVAIVSVPDGSIFMDTYEYIFHKRCLESIDMYTPLHLLKVFDFYTREI